MSTDTVTKNAGRFEFVDQETLYADEIARKNIGFWADAARRFKKNKVAMFFLVILLLLIVMSIIGPMISGKDYITIVGSLKNTSPNSEFWFGTDGLGRDMFARSWVGLRTSLIIAVVAAAVQLVVGCLYGSIMATAGGIVDEIMMRIVEVINSIPNLVLVTLLLVVFGNGYPQLLFALSISSWTGTARLVRGQIFKLRESEYVMASKALGGSNLHRIIKHLLPNTIGLLILEMAQSIPGVIFSETSLSFLGIGLMPPDFSLGSMLSQGQSAMAHYPYQLIVPCVLLSLLVLSFNVVGDALRDALDPQLRN